jgi:hypothetical protein
VPGGEEVAAVPAVLASADPPRYLPIPPLSQRLVAGRSKLAGIWTRRQKAERELSQLLRERAVQTLCCGFFTPPAPPARCVAPLGRSNEWNGTDELSAWPPWPGFDPRHLPPPSSSPLVKPPSNPSTLQAVRREERDAATRQQRARAERGAMSVRRERLTAARSLLARQKQVCVCVRVCVCVCVGSPQHRDLGARACLGFG